MCEAFESLNEKFFDCLDDINFSFMYGTLCFSTSVFIKQFFKLEFLGTGNSWETTGTTFPKFSPTACATSVETSRAIRSSILPISCELHPTHFNRLSTS